ncbi:1-deoxy-D-xylulose-5-phosphate reductoisomerase [Candidatus Neptunochlamydia vexilliferae]|nr:1-deoxy-D-xylulose-5-phosphate reductoisomerase [Candidatus Neptunochlamydia vexilliferae]
MKNIAILGSTGSIGTNTLEVAAHLGYEVSALAAHSNIDLLEAQVQKFHPKCVAVFDRERGEELKRRLPDTPIVFGMEGLVEAATLPEVDFVVSAIVGAAGIVPTLRAIETGKTIGLANKEVLIAAGELIMEAAKKQNVQILPIDSEHSAIFQCLQGESPSAVDRLILTASGGPFRNYSYQELEAVKPEKALNHPNWKMGKKITIDSSTLMNKGLEVIEAKFLFNTPVEKIAVVVHPQSIVHSLVEYVDGSLIAQMGVHDMRVPIQYALTYPERKKGISPCFDFQKWSKLEFFKPDLKKFPCLRLAYEAAKVGGTLPCFMNGANEVLVHHFLEGKIRWVEIGQKLETLMEAHKAYPQESLETLLEVDKEARTLAMTL